VSAMVLSIAHSDLLQSQAFVRAHPWQRRVDCFDIERAQRWHSTSPNVSQRQQLRGKTQSKPFVIAIEMC
jgi:hypothetical protein